MPSFFRDNALSLTLASLALLALLGTALSGHTVYNQLQTAGHQPTVGLSAYVRTGTFLDALFENWQAAVLQLLSLVFLGVFLRQRGAAHSKKRVSEGNVIFRKKGRIHSWAYDHSLELVLFGLFVLMFVLHALTGAAAWREQARLAHLPEIGCLAFLRSAQFWFLTFQTWQAEYSTIALYLVMSIFLRESNSPESKPLSASNDDTGEHEA